MEALGFASDWSLGSLPLQAWAESCPHCRRGLFSWVWLSKYRRFARVLGRNTCSIHHRHQRGPSEDARGCPCTWT